MFLRCSTRRKDGKEHLYWSVVGNRRVGGDRIVQRHVLYQGELNGRQEASWRKSVELFGQDDEAPQQVALFPEEYAPDTLGTDELAVRWNKCPVIGYWKMPIMSDGILYTL
jgi:hypothetical protein